MSDLPGAPPGRLQRAALLAGPALGLLLYGADLDPGNPRVAATAALAALMATWWMTEAIPLAATALLPLVLLPALGVMSGKLVAQQYANHIIFLFIGGFIVAIAMRRWQLHRRIALSILARAGVNPRAMLLAFMAATWFLSMWISNTAAAMMMVPIALAIVAKLEEGTQGDAAARLARALLLGVAYGSSIGGIATLVGTPPNMSFARILHIAFPRAPEVSFSTWFLFAFPVSVAFLGLAWGYLAWRLCPGREEITVEQQVLAEQRRQLGPLTFEQGVVLAAFVGLVLLWMTRGDLQLGQVVIPGWARLLPQPKLADDGTVAIGVALLLFVIPSRSEPGRRIVEWREAAELPWGVILLFGGGFALATGFTESGLSAWLGARLQVLEALPPLLLVGAVCLVLTFLTELTSNTATAEMLLPVLAALAVATKTHPLLLMVPATLACSFAFMLPVATPPNAIVFGSERLSIGDMARAGLALNLIGVVLVTCSIFLLGGALGIESSALPDWAR